MGYLRYAPFDEFDRDPAGLDVSLSFSTTGAVFSATDLDYTSFASGYEPVGIVDVLANPVGYTGPQLVFLTTDFQLYRYDNSVPEWVSSTGVAAGDIIGTLTSAQIASLDAAKLTGAITETQIADDAITTAKISVGAVVTASLAANAITATQIASGAITTVKLAAGSITTDKIAANQITTGLIVAGAITTSQLAVDAVTADKIAANSIAAGKINVSTLSAISANLGAVTAGSISINGKFIVDSLGNVTIQSSPTGARLVLTNSTVLVYDATRLRVRLGIW